jgi:hypothetical protein
VRRNAESPDAPGTIVALRESGIGAVDSARDEPPAPVARSGHKTAKDGESRRAGLHGPIQLPVEHCP